MLSLNDYFLIFPDLFNATGAVTQIIPTPDGGRLAEVIVTYTTALTVDTETITFSAMAADGTATAITNGAITTTVAATAIGATVTDKISPQSDGTDVIPAGGGLKVVSNANATAGTYRVGVIMRRD